MDDVALGYIFIWCHLLGHSLQPTLQIYPFGARWICIDLFLENEEVCFQAIHLRILACMITRHTRGLYIILNMNNECKQKITTRFLGTKKSEQRTRILFYNAEGYIGFHNLTGMQMNEDAISINVNMG